MIKRMHKISLYPTTLTICHDKILRVDGTYSGAVHGLSGNLETSDAGLFFNGKDFIRFIFFEN